MSYAVYGYESQICYYPDDAAKKAGITKANATKADCIRFLNDTYINFRKTLSGGGPSKVPVSEVLPEPMRIVEQHEASKSKTPVEYHKSTNKHWTDAEISFIRRNMSKSVLWLSSKLPDRSYSAVEQKCYAIQREMGVR